MTLTSRVSLRERPGICSSVPSWYDSTSSVTLLMHSWVLLLICRAASSGMSSSPIPVENPWFIRAPSAILVTWLMNLAARSEP